MEPRGAREFLHHSTVGFETVAATALRAFVATLRSGPDDASMIRADRTTTSIIGRRQNPITGAVWITAKVDGEPTNGHRKPTLPCRRFLREIVA